MGWWLVDADTLAGSRFLVSPLAETIACLKLLHRARAAHPGEREWLDTWLPAYRERLDSVDALLVDAALRPTWTADFLAPTPTGEERAFEEELAVVRDYPPERALEDLAVSLGGPVPPRLRRSDLPGRAADLVAWIWREAVLPTWDRRRRVLEADIVARTAQLTQGGWAAAFHDMRPGMRWLGKGKLQINAYDNPPRDISGGRLMFVPVTPHVGQVSWDSGRYALVYPCSGVLVEPSRRAPEALGRLLGTARATVLVLLGQPKSTTQLVALTGQGLGSVGRHLKVLMDAGLIQRRRAGRSVLYYRTPAGDVLTRAGTR
ncbi:helix-turn-helix domain-containing protein [Thermoactinospora rubra]|uniref:helix-turn-helix domain-containing protein n=1 Tax=Thermoactinospora rubra TaxID=1088767 RepID=UPI000A122EA8|nr:helix-turn-helix domain-containing protein [Thermoactinospora rubra]